MSKKKQNTRILVVEDNGEWRRALVDMYKSILGDRNCTVLSAETPQEAIDMLEDGDYQLLSLDINLSTHAEGGNGMDVLEEAAGRELVNGVVVITGVMHDEKLEVAIPDKDRLLTAQIALGDYVNSWFVGPERNCVLYKRPIIPPAEQIEDLQAKLPAERIRALVAPKGAAPSFPPPYYLSFHTQTSPPRVVVHRVGGKKGDTREIVENTDRMFLEQLARFRKHGAPSYLSKELVVGIFRGGDWLRSQSPAAIAKAAEIDVQTVRQRLRRRDIIVESLFEPERGKGYRLLPESDLRVVGLGDVGGVTTEHGMDSFADDSPEDEPMDEDSWPGEDDDGEDADALARIR